VTLCCCTSVRQCVSLIPAPEIQIRPWRGTCSSRAVASRPSARSEASRALSRVRDRPYPPCGISAASEHRRGRRCATVTRPAERTTAVSSDEPIRVTAAAVLVTGSRSSFQRRVSLRGAGRVHWASCRAEAAGDRQQHRPSPEAPAFEHTFSISHTPVSRREAEQGRRQRAAAGAGREQGWWPRPCAGDLVTCRL
jgi:hypothetical protein